MLAKTGEMVGSALERSFGVVLVVPIVPVVTVSLLYIYSLFPISLSYPVKLFHFSGLLFGFTFGCWGGELGDFWQEKQETQ
jgi:hypothetical protein